MDTESQSQNSTELDNPIANYDPPKSRRKLWFFGGLGCLFLLIVACIVGVVVMVAMGLKPIRDFQTEAISFATATPQVEELLGTPITDGKTNRSTTEESGVLEFKTPLSGPNGTGTLVFKGRVEGTTWTREEIFFEFEGEEYDLDEDELFNLDIDMGE